MFAVPGSRSVGWPLSRTSGTRAAIPFQSRSRSARHADGLLVHVAARAPRPPCRGRRCPARSRCPRGAGARARRRAGSRPSSCPCGCRGRRRPSGRRSCAPRTTAGRCPSRRRRSAPCRTSGRRRRGTARRARARSVRSRRIGWMRADLAVRVHDADGDRVGPDRLADVVGIDARRARPRAGRSR